MPALKKRQLAWFLIAGILAPAVAADATTAAEAALGTAAVSTAIPLAFSASTGSGMGSAYTVELKQGALLYSARRVNQPPETARMAPSAAQWQNFRRALDAQNVWSWKTRYADERIMDGVQWSLEIAYADRRLKSNGSNAYPAVGKGAAGPQMSPEFVRYLKAVQALIGGRAFY